MFGNNSYDDAKAYAKDIGDRMIRMNTVEFFEVIRSNFYPEINTDFMRYFISITGVSGFIVPHRTLVDYGVVTSKESNDMHKRLKRLNMIEGVDYEIRESIVNRQGRGPVVKKEYHLTASTFKLCLMRASKFKGQPIDHPSIYVKYYILLETIYSIYDTYKDALIESILGTTGN